MTSLQDDNKRLFTTVQELLQRCRVAEEALTECQIEASLPLNWAVEPSRVPAVVVKYCQRASAAIREQMAEYAAIIGRLDNELIHLCSMPEPTPDNSSVIHILRSIRNGDVTKQESDI